MDLSEHEQHRLMKLANQLCSARNHNVPVELAKADYKLVDNGIEFFQAQFKLDSNHSDYQVLVAKIIRLSDGWQLFVAQRDKHEMFERWHSYPEKHTEGQQLHQLMAEVEHDPMDIIW